MKQTPPISAKNYRSEYLTYKNGSLHFGDSEIAIEPLLKDYDRPCFVYDLKLMDRRLTELQSTLRVDQKPFDIYYAMKANAHPDLLKSLKNLGAGVDVVSGGEIDCAMEAGFLPYQIVYSGVGKTQREIEKALRLGIHQINVESIPELERIGETAARLGRKAAIALRLNPNIDIKTHPYIATGLHENKFGIEISALPAIEKVLQTHSRSIELVGISLHLGSMMLEFEGLRQALKLLRPVYESLQQKYPSVCRFDIGGGLGIIYDRQDMNSETKLLQEYAKIVEEELKGLKAEYQTEPGRWLVAHGGILISQIQYVKVTSHKTFYIIDSGMNHLVRPSLYGAHHGIYSLMQNADQAQKSIDVVGPICESSDFFAKNRMLPEMKAGEFLIIADTGAYGFSMSSRYNQHEPAQEICIRANK